MADSSTTLPDVQSLLRQLRENYLAEMDERLGAIESDLLALDRTERFAEAFERAYRKLHALKSGASAYGLSIIAKICYQQIGRAHV